MAVEICNGCDRLVDLDWDCEGTYDENENYYCFPCIEKNGWEIDEHTNKIMKGQRVE